MNEGQMQGQLSTETKFPGAMETRPTISTREPLAVL